MKNNGRNEYDETKKMLATLREFKNSSYSNNLNEQNEIGREPNFNNEVPQGNEGSDFAVVNNVEIVMHSTDELDHELKEDEKGKISQLIDDFRAEISELVEFNKLHIYDDSAKLDGILSDVNLNFVLSAGDDTGVFIGNSSLLKISDEIMEKLAKMKDFSNKFAATISEIISNRRQN